MKSKLRTQWQTADLDSVIGYYAKGFTPDDGDEILGVSYFVDTQKGKVVFEITVREKSKP